jgi:hypothetical protein
MGRSALPEPQRQPSNQRNLRSKNRTTPLRQISVFTTKTPTPFGKPKKKKGPKKRKSNAGRPMSDPNKYAKPFGKDYCWSPKCPNPGKIYPITPNKGVYGLQYHPHYPGDRSKKICTTCFKRYKVISSVCMKSYKWIDCKPKSNNTSC